MILRLGHLWFHTALHVRHSSDKFANKKFVTTYVTTTNARAEFQSKHYCVPTGGVKLLTRNLRACLQEVTSSLRLFKLARSALQIMKYFSHRHKLQRFEAELKGAACFKIFQVKLNPILAIDLRRLASAALEFASKHVTICDDERHIILQAKSSLLYNSGEPCSKRTSSNLFDVTMASYDGDESCELVGTYLLHSIKERFGNACNFGLYRDDGLG